MQILVRNVGTGWKEGRRGESERGKEERAEGREGVGRRAYPYNGLTTGVYRECTGGYGCVMCGDVVSNDVTWI